MLSRNDIPQTRRRQGTPQRQIKSPEEKVLFVCIIEVERVADFIVPRERPVIALCDSGSQTSWVSSQFIEDLEKSTSNTLKNTRRLESRRGGEPLCINIRWSCDKLRQYHEQGTFFVEPNAQFKILFGCASRISRPPSSTKSYVSKRYTWRHSDSPEKQQHIKDSTIDSFRKGIEDGTLLPLRKAAAGGDHGIACMNVGDLEMELDYAWGTYSSTDKALSSAADEDSAYQISSYGDIPDLMEIASIRDSESENDIRSATESANTSVSCGSYQGHALTERLRRDRYGAQPTFSLQGWVTQPTYEEPWVGARVAPLEERPLSFNRCRDLSPKYQTMLATARTAAVKHTTEYWIWDAEKRNYKHYDEGCSEPIWYNPP